MRIRHIFMAVAMAAMSIGITGCGDDEPDVVIPGEGNTPGSVNDENTNISLVSRQISSNGIAFTPGDALELTVKDLVIDYDGAPGTVKQITLVMDDTPVTTLYDLPATFKYDKISSLAKGEHTVKGIVMVKSADKIGELTVDLFKFYVVAEKPKVELNPTLLSIFIMSGVGSHGQQYWDQWEEEYTLKEGTPLSIDVPSVNSSIITFTGQFSIGVPRPTANCEYQIKNMKTYILKDWNSDQVINLPQLTESDVIEFKRTSDKNIGFNKLTFVFSYILETTIDGIQLPSVLTTNSYDVILNEE